MFKIFISIVFILMMLSCTMPTTFNLKCEDISNKIFSYKPTKNTYQVEISVKKEDTSLAYIAIYLNDKLMTHQYQLKGRLDTLFWTDWYNDKFGISTHSPDQVCDMKVKLQFCH